MLVRNPPRDARLTIRRSVGRAMLHIDHVGGGLVDYPLAQAFRWTGAKLYANFRGKQGLIRHSEGVRG